LFHFSDIIGYKSPTDVIESPMRVAANGPTAVVSVPLISALDLPNIPVTPIAVVRPAPVLQTYRRGKQHEVGLRIQIRVEIDI
jgi:hypothetical protein